MITREQAVFAYTDQTGVFDPDGTEVTIKAVGSTFDSAIVEYNSSESHIFRFSELSPSRRLLDRMDGQC